jgi:hypothetical protein
MKLKALLILIFLMSRMSLVYGAKIRVLPVTVYEGEWYGLFGHPSNVEDVTIGWTDFKEKRDVVVADQAHAVVKILREQTNGVLDFTKEYVYQNSVSLLFNKDRVYFVYYELPKGQPLEYDQYVLNRQSQKIGFQSPFKDFAWLPIKKILNNKTLSTDVTSFNFTADLTMSVSTKLDKVELSPQLF